MFLGEENMFRKLLLLICLAFVIIGFAYPCVIMPVGSYTATVGKVSTSYKFAFDGTLKITVETSGSNSKGVTTDAFYKLKGNKVIISLDDKFNDNDMQLQICSIYSLAGGFKNTSAIVVASGVGVIALLLIVTIPSKRKLKRKIKE